MNPEIKITSSIGEKESKDDNNVDIYGLLGLNNKKTNPTILPIEDIRLAYNTRLKELQTEIKDKKEYENALNKYNKIYEKYLKDGSEQAKLDYDKVYNIKYETQAELNDDIYKPFGYNNITSIDEFPKVQEMRTRHANLNKVTGWNSTEQIKKREDILSKYFNNSLSNMKGIGLKYTTLKDYNLNYLKKFNVRPTNNQYFKESDDESIPDLETIPEDQSERTHASMPSLQTIKTNRSRFTRESIPDLETIEDDESYWESLDNYDENLNEEINEDETAEEDEDEYEEINTRLTEETLYNFLFSKDKFPETVTSTEDTTPYLEYSKSMTYVVDIRKEIAGATASDFKASKSYKDYEKAYKYFINGSKYANEPEKINEDDPLYPWPILKLKYFKDINNEQKSGYGLPKVFKKYFYDMKIIPSYYIDEMDMPNNNLTAYARELGTGHCGICQNNEWKYDFTDNKNEPKVWASKKTNCIHMFHDACIIEPEVDQFCVYCNKNVGVLTSISIDFIESFASLFDSLKYRELIPALKLFNYLNACCDFQYSYLPVIFTLPLTEINFNFIIHWILTTLNANSVMYNQTDIYVMNKRPQIVYYLSVYPVNKELRFPDCYFKWLTNEFRMMLYKIWNTDFLYVKKNLIGFINEFLDLYNNPTSNKFINPIEILEETLNVFINIQNTSNEQLNPEINVPPNTTLKYRGYTCSYLKKKDKADPLITISTPFDKEIDVLESYCLVDTRCQSDNYYVDLYGQVYFNRLPKAIKLRWVYS